MYKYECSHQEPVCSTHQRAYNQNGAIKTKTNYKYERKNMTRKNMRNK